MEKKRLKVCDPSGKVVIAETELKNGKVFFRVPFLKVVKLDNPDFSKNGVIQFTVPQAGYQKAKKQITKYLEDLFLKELGKDETVYSSNGNKTDNGGVEKDSSTGNPEQAGGENDHPVHNRGRGGKSSKNNRGRSSKGDVAKSGDSDSGGESEKRD